MSASPWWPLFDLTISTPRLRLVYPTDGQLVEIADLAAGGIHDPAVMPFGVPFTDLPTDGTQQRGTLQHLWLKRATFAPDNWHLTLAVELDGQIVGMQDALAKDFDKLGAFETGSWLGKDFQGIGIGKEMRAAVLHLLFEGLGASEACTRAWAWNAASNGVTKALGYEPNGQDSKLVRGKPTLSYNYRLPRDEWLKRRRDDIVIEGLAPCRALFGLT